MGAVLFKVFGFDVTGRLLSRVVLGIVGAGILFLAYSKINGHFEYIDGLEKDNKTLQSDLTYAQGQLDLAIEVNKQNQATQKAKDDIAAQNRATAEAEKAAATARAQTYKEIRNAIDHSPPSDPRPVAPVITDTLDRLWSPNGTEGANAPPANSVALR